MINWLTRGAAWVSQGINWFFLFGNHDQTVSARCYVNRHRLPWKCGYHIINMIFFWQKDHCYTSFLVDREFARKVLMDQ